MIGLGQALEEHKVAIRRDFQQFYGLDIADVWRGTLTVARAVELLEGLAFEPHSQYRAEALGGSQHNGMDRSTFVLMDLFDAVQAGTFVNAKVQGAKPKKPEPYPRSGVAGDNVPTPPAEGRLAGQPLQPTDQPITIENFPIEAVVAMTRR